MNKVLFHGECVIREIEQLPQGLNPVEPKNGYVVVAESEVTGNDHRVKVNGLIEFYEKDGVLYAKVLKETTVGCVFKERHDDCIITPGIWEFNKAVEFDPIEQELRSVAD